MPSLSDYPNAGVIVVEVPSPIKTDFDYPYGPAHADYEGNVYSQENPDSNNNQQRENK